MTLFIRYIYKYIIKINRVRVMVFNATFNNIQLYHGYAMLLSFWIIFTGEHIMVNIHFNFLFILTIQHYVIKFVSIFLRVLSSTNKTDRHDITVLQNYINNIL
jgi:hypothetical protein